MNAPSAPWPAVRRGGKNALRSAALYGGLILATLALVDLACILFGLFPPRVNPGDPEVGWRAASPTGEMHQAGCEEYSTGQVVRYVRNEDGLRTSLSAQQLHQDDGLYKVAVGGDSQTDLCAPNSETHFGVMERALNELGLKAVAFAYGAGKYSPLQAYRAIDKVATRYRASALVLNFYTGNDFQDMLRVDDRPYFVVVDTGYAIHAPVWYQEDPPDAQYRSRVLYVLRSVAKRTRVRNVSLRIRYLYEVADQQGSGLGTVLGYMNDLRKGISSEVGYPAAFLAQMLNQQLFFRRFPHSREESTRRVRALLLMARQEHPDMLLVLSALPSYQLVQQQPVDSALLRVLHRLPTTYEQGVREEQELYDLLRGLAAETGWVFVDNLEPLRNYGGHERLFNDFDYHLLPVASEIIGRAQAAAIATALRNGRTPYRR